MATVIIRTTAGAAHDKAVREGAAAASPYKYIHLLDGAPVTDVTEILSLDTVVPSLISHTFTRHSDDDSEFPLTEEGDTWSRFEPHLPETVACQINAIALMLENGVLWGYAPYQPAQGGLTKTAAFSWTLDLLIVESTREATALQLTYEPLDYRVIRDRLEAQLYERLRTAFYATICNITAAPLHEDGDCLEIPFSESAIINTERNIVAEPIKE